MKLKEILISILHDVNKISQERNYNFYIKQHTAEKMFMLMLYYQMTGSHYGRSFTLFLKHQIGDTTETLSQSELSKKLSYKLPVELFKEMYESLLLKAKSSKSKKIKKLIRIIDATALSATPTMTYAKHRENKNGFKMHTVIDEDYLVEDLQLKNGNSSDKKSLKWAIIQGFIHIFDRGYNDFSVFRYIEEEKNAYFVTRALSNIKYETIINNRIGHKQKEYGIIADKMIKVLENRKEKNEFFMRMITFQFIDSTGRLCEFSLLTNLLNERSDSIAELYRERWNIEVVFRWLKMFLKIDHWLSRSRNGVLIQIYSALCVYLMAFIAKAGDVDRYTIMKDSIYEFIIHIKEILRFIGPGSNIEEICINST